jgi:hypothetical protein
MIPDEIKNRSLFDFEPTPAMRAYNAFLKHGWRTIGDVIAAIELNGVFRSDRADHPFVAGHAPRNAGKKAHDWLFAVLDSIGYDWRSKVVPGYSIYANPNPGVPETIRRIADDLNRLAEAWRGLPDDLKELIKTAVRELEP